MASERKTQDIQRGIDGMAQRAVRQAHREGREITGEQARKIAASIAERAEKKRARG